MRKKVFITVEYSASKEIDVPEWADEETIRSAIGEIVDELPAEIDDFCPYDYTYSEC